MAISIARAKAKESSANDKAKRGPLSNSETTPKSTIESTKPAPRSSSNDHKARTLSERQIQSHVKPKTSSRSESQFKSLKAATQKPKPSVNRKPASASISSKPKAKAVSSSRPHKALLSPGPPHKTPPLLRTSSNPTPSSPKTTLSPKFISKTTSLTPRAAKPKPLSSKKGMNTKKTAPATKKKVADAPVNSTNTPEGSDASAGTSTLETVPSVTEQVSGVLKVEDDEHQEVEKVSEIPPHVDSTEQHEQQHKVEPDQHQIQADDERAIPSEPEGKPVSVAEVGGAKGEPKEEKTKDESTSQGGSNNWRHPDEQPATDGDAEVKEKEKEKGGVIEDEESENNNKGKTLKEKEGEETRISEDKTDSDELVPKSEVEKVNTESTPTKEEAGKEFQACAKVIEETASKLLETRKTKVKALAGAFQSVIDHQTSSI